MPGPSRINVLGLFCSCVSHAALLGGILIGLMETRPKAVGERPSTRPLVIELIPLAGEAEGKPHPASPAAQSNALVAASRPRHARREAKQIPLGVVRPAALLQGDMAAGAAMSSSTESATRSSDFSAYQRRLYEAIARSSRYPAEARRAHLAGVTTLAFTIDRSGAIEEFWIQKSSGSELLDTAALEALEGAKPLPPIPASLPGRIEFVIELDLSVLQSAALQTVG